MKNSVKLIRKIIFQRICEDFNLKCFISKMSFIIPGFNLRRKPSTVVELVQEYRKRLIEYEKYRHSVDQQQVFRSFAETRLSIQDFDWTIDNYRRFIEQTPNDIGDKPTFLSQLGYIMSLTYSPDGSHLIVGHSSGLIQDDQNVVLQEFANRIHVYYRNESSPNLWYPMFHKIPSKKDKSTWIRENYTTFLKDTKNGTLYNRWYFSECGYITAMTFSPNGKHIVVGYGSGLVQMRHGSTGAVMCTLRNVQFPHRPIYALEYSKLEERICYAACSDGVIYRLEVPNITPSVVNPPEFCIRVDPALESLHMQFYGAPGISSHSSPYIVQRYSVLSMGILADQSKLAAGYSDASVKVFDMETQEATNTYKVHKLRLQYIPKKLQRNHTGQVCALRAHKDLPYMFASAAWDDTLRIWDIRCKIGCVMTFEVPNICADSIDINREQCVSASWTPIEGLSVWDLTTRKRLNIVRVQNRRPDVDGEYFYTCRYWNSTDYNRKGKYVLVGGSGTNCVEIINIHNRYIACSYPVPGSVLTVTSHQDRIAFGGTASVFNIVSFHDPKHEKYNKELEDEDNPYIFDLSLYYEKFSDLEYPKSDKSEFLEQQSGFLQKRSEPLEQKSSVLERKSGLDKTED